MNNQEFLQAKIKSFTPEFKNLIGLKKSDHTSRLIEFMTKLHPSQCRQAQGCKGEVFGKKHYVFTLYTTGVLRTTVDSGAKRFYPLCESSERL